MMNMMMLAAAAAGGTSCPSCACPPHAIAAVAGALVIGGAIGFWLGRRGGGKCACAKGDKGGKGATQSSVARHASTPSTPRQPIPAGSVEIYVGNLSYDLTEDELRKVFEEFGEVASTRVVTDKGGTRSKGFGFVVMPNRPEAEKAIAAMSEKEVRGRKMRVNEARNTLKQEEA